MFRQLAIAAASLAAVVVSGCASFEDPVVTTELLETRTAFALGLEKGDFTISDRVDDGGRIDYSVKTRRGKVYRCYVTSMGNVWGPIIGGVKGSTSDAICSPKGGGVGNPLTR